MKHFNSNSITNGREANFFLVIIIIIISIIVHLIGIVVASDYSWHSWHSSPCVSTFTRFVFYSPQSAFMITRRQFYVRNRCTGRENKIWHTQTRKVKENVATNGTKRWNLQVKSPVSLTFLLLLLFHSSEFCFTCEVIHSSLYQSFIPLVFPVASFPCSLLLFFQWKDIWWNFSSFLSPPLFFSLWSCFHLLPLLICDLVFLPSSLCIFPFTQLFIQDKVFPINLSLCICLQSHGQDESEMFRHIRKSLFVLSSHFSFALSFLLLFQ